MDKRLTNGDVRPERDEFPCMGLVLGARRGETDETEAPFKRPKPAGRGPSWLCAEHIIRERTHYEA